MIGVLDFSGLCQQPLTFRAAVKGVMMGFIILGAGSMTDLFGTKST